DVGEPDQPAFVGVGVTGVVDLLEGRVGVGLDARHAHAAGRFAAVAQALQDRLEVHRLATVRAALGGACRARVGDVARDDVDARALGGESAGGDAQAGEEFAESVHD